jgi:hypothetical protein
MTHSIPNLHPDWITNRLPTAADADHEGDGWLPEVPKALTGDCSENSWQHWSLVVPGQPWWSEKAAANPTPPATSPAPAPTRKVVQIAVESPATEGDYAYIYALCNDGTILFHGVGTDQPWRQLPPIPQPEAAQ